MIQTLSHQQAQKFIHAAADSSLKPSENTALEIHLRECAECRSFAQEFTRMESALRQTMRHRWNASIRPIHLERILGWQKKTPFRHALSIAAAPAMVALLVFAILLTRGPFSSGSDLTATVIATNIPTPSAQLTHTNTAASDCASVYYTVQNGDTLESISAAFSVSKDAIVRFNDLHGEQLTLSSILIIPLCERQFTSTPTTTLTFTPSISAVPSTP